MLYALFLKNGCTFVTGGLLQISCELHVEQNLILDFPNQ